MPPREPTMSNIDRHYDLPRRQITRQEEDLMRNRFAHQNRVELEAWRRQRRRERVLQEHDEFVNDLLNFEFQQEPIPTFEGIVLPPPPRIQRQQAQQVTATQNQQNIQNNINQPPPRFL